MGLYERLAQPRSGEVEVGPPGPSPETAGPDPLATLRKRLHDELLRALGPRLYDLSLDPTQLEERVRATLPDLLAQVGAPVSATERQRVITETIDDILGNGPIESLLKDPSVTEVMCNGPNAVFVERNGKLTRTAARFLDDEHLRRTIDKIVAMVGRRIDESQPFVDARLSDGSRVNAVIPPVAIDGPTLTIRKFSSEAYQVEDLLSFGTLSARAGTLLEACVRGRLNVLVSGGTGAGKTTTLNVLSSFVPTEERIVTIEDAAELRLMQPHVVRLEYRPPNIEGRGEVRIRDLVRNALRMRPDRIVVGEVRGGEALDMLQAMNTGHDGGLSTIHANSPRDALARLETMTLMAGMELPLRAVREQIASAIQIVVHQARLLDGTRRVTRISEITGMEGDVIALQDLFRFDFGMGRDDSGQFLGHLKPTGIRPRVSDRLLEQGIDLGPELFEPEPFAAETPR